MEEKSRDKSVVKEGIGDPAFYNDQITSDKVPVKKKFENKTSSKRKCR